MGANAGRSKPALQPVHRRTFLRYSLVGATSAGLGGFALASFGFLWPRPGGELVGEVAMGDAHELVDLITSERAPVRVPAAGVSILVWDPSVSAAMRNYGDDHRAVIDEATALMAVDSANCPHLGCAVPWCQSSQWFECPCHGSRYNRWGEWTGGPAPRGLDRYPSFIDEATNQFVADLSTHLSGPARTANALGRTPKGRRAWTSDEAGSGSDRPRFLLAAGPAEEDDGNGAPQDRGAAELHQYSAQGSRASPPTVPSAVRVRSAPLAMGRCDTAAASWRPDRPSAGWLDLRYDTLVVFPWMIRGQRGSSSAPPAGTAARAGGGAPELRRSSHRRPDDRKDPAREGRVRHGEDRMASRTRASAHQRSQVGRTGQPVPARQLGSPRSRTRLRVAAVVVVIAVGVVWLALGPVAGGPASGQPVQRFMHVHGLDIAPWAPDEVFVSTHEGLIRIDADGDWWFVSEVPHDFMGFAVDPTEPDVMYSSGHPAPGSGLANPIGFMVSTDAGTSWTPRSLEGQVDFHAMAVQPSDGRVVYGWDVTGGGLHRTTDAGNSWQTVPAGLLEQAGGALSLAVDAVDADRVLAGTQIVLLVSEDGGDTWVALLELPVTAVTTVSAEPDRVLAYAATPDEGLLESRDGGDTWTPLGLTVADDAVGHIAVHPEQPDTIYVGTFGEDLYRTLDGGGSWEQLARAGQPAAP